MDYTGRRKSRAKKKSQGTKVREAKNPTKIQKMRADKIVGNKNKSYYA